MHDGVEAGKGYLGLGQPLDPVPDHRDAVGKNATADQEHRQGAEDRQPLHQQRCALEQSSAQGLCQAAVLLRQVEPQVVELDQPRHQAVDTHGDQQADGYQHRDLLAQGGGADGAQRDDNDLRRENEVGADGALDLVAFKGLHVGFAVGQRRQSRLALLLGVFLVQELVGQLFGALEAQKGPAKHQQYRHQPGHEGADQQRAGNQETLVEQRPLGHRPHHRQLAIRRHAGDLLGIECQIVAENTGGLLGRHLGHHRDIVEQGGDVVDQS